MYPVLFKIPVFGGITVFSYGVMVALGFLAALAWISYDSKKQGQNAAQCVDLAFYVIIAALAGSRILHVAVAERERFLSNPLMIFRIWEGGLVFYGGLIAALAVSLWYISRRRMPLFLTCDVFSPALALGHAIGRIGCFLAGCCYGRVVDHASWASVVFPEHPKGFAPSGLSLYPTQLMESAGEFIIFGLLLVVRRRKSFDGQLFALYLMLYALLRFSVEFLRGDIERGFVVEPWFSTSSLISVFIFAAGAAIYAWLWMARARERGGGRS